MFCNLDDRDWDATYGTFSPVNIPNVNGASFNAFILKPSLTESILCAVSESKMPLPTYTPCMRVDNNSVDGFCDLELISEYFKQGYRNQEILDFLRLQGVLARRRNGTEYKTSIRSGTQLTHPHKDTRVFKIGGQ